jgi:hypothetical protein
MVQFYRGSADPRDAAYGALAQALGEGLGEGINSHYANKALDEVINDPTLKDAPISTRMGKIQTALAPYGKRGEKLLQNRMMIEQQIKQEDEQAVLGKIAEGKPLAEKDYAKLSPENLFKVQEFEKKRSVGKNVYDALINAGYPEETAKIWQSQMENAPQGGQSDVIKNVNDLIKRSKSGKGIGQNPEEKQRTKPTIQIPGIESEEFELDFPDLPESVLTTPADMVKQNEHREKVNVPVYTETVDRLNALDDEFREVQHLQELNEIPGALPTGLQKWNVNWDTGDLRVKALATPEAQDYVKTIARMARRAKDFFPGRVTNFDLDQFKQGFPTLANSPEGRRIIAEQLILGNRIAYLKDETLKAAYDHYGSGADPIEVKKYATENYKRLKGKLEDQLRQTNSRAQSFIDSQPGEAKERPPIEKAQTLEDLF